MRSRGLVAGHRLWWNDVEPPGCRSLQFVKHQSLESGQIATARGQAREAHEQALLGRGADPEDGIGRRTVRDRRRNPDDEQRGGDDRLQDTFHFGFRANVDGCGLVEHT